MSRFWPGCRGRGGSASSVPGQASSPNPRTLANRMIRRAAKPESSRSYCPGIEVPWARRIAFKERCLAASIMTRQAATGESNSILAGEYPVGPAPHSRCSRSGVIPWSVRSRGYIRPSDVGRDYKAAPLSWPRRASARDPSATRQPHAQANTSVARRPRFIRGDWPYPCPSHRM